MNVKKFIGQYAYRCVRDLPINASALKTALVTPSNARAVFKDLTEYEVRSLVEEINSSYKEPRQLCKATRDEIRAAFAAAGYTTVIFDDREQIMQCKRYYRPNELICTYNNLDGRMRDYHIIVAIHANAETIVPAQNPQRDDAYGTSVLNIQVARNGSHMSIKNRYNHTVPRCDSTLDNNLDKLYPGLQAMVLGYYGLSRIDTGDRFKCSIVKIGGVYLKYSIEYGNRYVGDFVLDVHGPHYVDKSRYHIMLVGPEMTLTPVVLDFHKKRAIPLRRDDMVAPLLTRALQEGVLHSGNKGPIQAIFPNAGHELLESNRRALKYAAHAAPFDFQKPYIVTAICGYYTIADIAKIIGDRMALILVVAGWVMRSLLFKPGLNIVKEALPNSSYYNCMCGSWDHVDLRLTERNDMMAYIITQDACHHRRWVSEFSCDRDSTYDSLCHPPLSYRLQDYKKQKRRAEARNIDYTGIAEEFQNKFTALKEKIVGRFISAKQTNDYYPIGDVTGPRLWRLIDNIDDFRRKAEEKNFKSRQHAEGLKTSILEQFAMIYEKLDSNPSNNS